MNEAKLIKSVDEQLREFIGGTEIHIESVFNDPAQYRRMIDKFWSQKISKKAVSA